MGHKTQNQTDVPASLPLTPEVHAALFASLLQNPTLGFWVLDENDLIIQVNDAYLRRSGYTRQELLGQSVSMVEAQETPEKIVRHRETTKEQGQHLFETLHRTKDGEVWPVEVSATYANGRFFAIIQDITHRKKTESELRQKSKALENSLNGFDIVSADGKFIYANRAYLTMWGYDSLDEIIGTSPARHCADPNTATQIIQNLEAHGAYTLQFTALRKDGSTFEVFMAAQKMVDVEGTVTYVGTSIDITERKILEEALRKSEAQLAGIFASAMDAIVSIDENQKIVFFNPAAEQMFGYTAAEIIGQGHNILIPPRFYEVHAGHVDLFSQSGDNQRIMGNSKTLLGQRATGEEFPVEVSISRVNVDEKTFYTAIMRDITERKEAELGLRDSEERLELALQGADLGLWDLKLPDDVVYNERWAEMLGYTLAELEPHVYTWEKLIHPDDLPKVMEKLQAHLDGRTESYETVHRLHSKDGTWKWIQARGRVLQRDEAGNPLRMVGTHLDITERKRAQDALQESEEKLQLFINHAPAALAMFDREMRYLAHSQRWLTDFDLAGQEIIGRSHYEIFPEINERMKAIHQRGLTGEVLQGEDEPFVRANGRIQWTRWEQRPWYTPNNEVGGIVIFFEDITERKEAERAIRDSEERLELALKGADLGLWDWNIKTDQIIFNDRWAEMLGYTLAELESQQITWEDLVHPDDRSGDRELFQAHLDGRTPFYESVYRLRSKDDTWRWILDRGRVLQRDEAGQPLRVVGTHLDITERKLAEDALQESEERLQLFIDHAPAALAMFDHEMRYLAYSHRWLTDFDLEGQELTGRSHYDIFPEIPDWWKKIHQRCLAGEVMRSEEDPFVRLDDSTQWLRWEVRPWYSSNNEVGGIVIFSEDITERKRTEGKIEELQQILAQAETIAKIGSWKWDFTTQALTWSAEMYHLFSVDPADTHLDLNQIIQERIHPDDRATVEQSNANVMETHKPTPLEYRLVLPDGTQRTILAEGRLIRDESGQPTALVGYAQDITERKRAEQAIRESEERYHSTLENMLEGCQIIGFDWRYLYVNESVAKHGRTRVTHLRGQTMMEAYPGIETTELFAVLQHCMTQRTPHFMENKFEYEDGTYAWFDLSIQPVPEGLFILSIDITERKEAVEALRQSEERFAKAFHLSPAALSLTREDGTILDVNENYERMSGYSREELINQDATQLNIFTAEQRADLRQRMVAAGGRLREAEMTIRSKSGELRHMLYSVEAINIKGEPCALTLAFDITRRKQMQLDLQEMANNMAAAQAMTHSGSWEVHLTSDFELLEPHIWSDECFRIFGLEPGSTPVTGERFYELVHPEDRAGVRNIVDHHLKTHGEVEYEYRLVRPDGTVRTVLDRVMLIEDDQTHRPLKIVGFVQDITESKQAEATIAQLNQRMELILNSAGEGIYGVDVNGRITFINPAMAHMLGREPEELHGQEAHVMFHYAYPDGTPYPAEKCVIQAAVLNGTELYNEPDIFWHKDGSPIFVEFTTTPIYHADQVVGSVTMVRDVTQRKIAAEEQAILEEQLRQSQKMESIGRLAGGVAHDFNNQLAVIKLYGDLMRQGMNKQDPLLPKLEQIRQAVDRAANLTRQLLAFSRKQVLQPTMLNVNDLVTNLEKMLSRLIGEDIALSTNLQPNLWPIMADAGQIEQAIMNLMINARDAMPTGGMITLETRNLLAIEPGIHPQQDLPEGPCVLLAITDTGHGMDEETCKQIFEPFFTTKQPGKGTGLGLATVHGIVKQSGGAIYVYSEPEQGTTFKIYLPASQEALEQLTAVAYPDVAQTGSETILLVEDEPALCELIQETLLEIGYTVLASQSGGEALAIAKAYPDPIDLLLTDVVLPLMSGQEIARELTAVSPQTKVLFISGYMDDAVIRHGVLTADVNFLSKPFSRSALAAKVREVLDK